MVCILEFVVCNSSKSLRIWLIIGRNPSKNEALSRLVPLLPYQKISLHHEGFLRNKSFYQRFPSMYVGLFMVCILPFGLYIQGKWSVFSSVYLKTPLAALFNIDLADKNVAQLLLNLIRSNCHVLRLTEL